MYYYSHNRTELWFWFDSINYLYIHFFLSMYIHAYTYFKLFCKTIFFRSNKQTSVRVTDHDVRTIQMPEYEWAAKQNWWNSASERERERETQRVRQSEYAHERWHSTKERPTIRSVCIERESCQERVHTNNIINRCNVFNLFILSSIEKL